MCGIFGGKNLSENQFHAMASSLKHRGPDDFGILKFNNFTLGHRRLSIQDIKLGKQPFSIGRYAISYNGEIYNHIDIRKKYLQDVAFATMSDTETFLHLVIKYGFDYLEKIDGMFAACIIDKNKNKIFLIRDRAGKKPLYFLNHGKSFVFASELNAIVRSRRDLKMNYNHLQNFLRCGFLFKDSTPWENIYEVLPGHYYEIDLENIKIEKKRYFNILDYYNPTYAIKENLNNTVSMTDRFLRKSIKNRLISSDLEVGAFLSGGIDSSLIVAIASEYQNNLKTFTVKFDGQFDESPYAKLTSRMYNTDHHELKINMNLKNDIEKILCSYGEPFIDSSAIPSYYICKEAKKYVTVVLNGDGADELFGGYRRYITENIFFKQIIYFLSVFKKITLKPKNKLSTYNYIYRFMHLINKKGIDKYLGLTTDIFEDEFSFQNNNELKKISEYLLKCNLEGVNKLLYFDFEILLLSNLLVKMDIASMQNSLEVRSPFLSKYFLEFAPKISPDFKVKGLKTKHILRVLAKKYLHKTLINLPKRGFEISLKDWICGPLKEPIKDQLSTLTLSNNFLSSNFINRTINKNDSDLNEKELKMIWSIYCLETWYKNYAKEKKL